MDSVLLAPVLPGRAAAWKKVPIGTQLWCVRKQLATDIPGTLKTLGSMGYEAVELENAFGKSGAEWRQHLDAANLKACGFHHRLEAYVPKDKRLFGYFALPVLVGEDIVAAIDLKTDRQNRKLLMQKWSWVGKGAMRSLRKDFKRRIEEELHRFERFQLAE